MLLSELLKHGSKTLKQENIHTHLLDAELFLSNLLNTSREKILTLNDQKVSEEIIFNFNELIKKRSKKEPVAYLFKEKEFWSKKFIVDNSTLIPRPETEMLVERIIKYFKNKKIHILDVGTGSGCILLTLLDQMKKSKGIGIDISSKAIDIASKNSKKFKLTNKSKFFSRSLNQIFGYKVDLIVSNPPYIERKNIKNLSDDIKRFEPIIALDGGNDGLDLIKKVIYKSKDILKINGILALEIGNKQINKVSKILIDNNFRIGSIIKDYKNNVRCLLAYYR